MHLCTPSINTCKIHNTHVYALAARLRAHYIMCTIICCAYVYNLRDVMVSWRVNVPCVHRSLPPSGATTSTTSAAYKWTGCGNYIRVF